MNEKEAIPNGTTQVEMLVFKRPRNFAIYKATTSGTIWLNQKPKVTAKANKILKQAGWVEAIRILNDYLDNYQEPLLTVIKTDECFLERMRQVRTRYFKKIN